MQSTKLTHTALLAAVVGATFALTNTAANAAGPVTVTASQEKCYGVAKAGENSCASKNGNHSCAGQSKAAFSGQEFKAVPTGTCEKMMGSLMPFDGMNPKIKG